MSAGSAGSAIRAIREGLGLSLQQVAGIAGTSPSYLAQVERDQRVPSDQWMRDVKAALVTSMRTRGGRLNRSRGQLGVMADHLDLYPSGKGSRDPPKFGTRAGLLLR